LWSNESDSTFTVSYFRRISSHTGWRFNDLWDLLTKVRIHSSQKHFKGDATALSDSEWRPILHIFLDTNRITTMMILLIFWLLPPSWVAYAVAPPHPNHTSWESVDAYRRRLGIRFNYKPRYLSSPEHCRFLTEEICARDDEATREAREGRRLTTLSGDNLKVLVLLLRFTDHADRALPPVSYFETLFNGKGPSDINPVGSIREYMSSNSFGKYNVTFDIQPWATTANTEAYYSGGESGLRGAEKGQEMIKPLLDALDNQGYNWASLDSDGWGDLDHLVVIHSGKRMLGDSALDE
jgi:hypothetical protein